MPQRNSQSFAVKFPVSNVREMAFIAAAAAIIGLTRCVRPPRPWRPSKLRLLVEAQRSPGFRMSGFMPRHIEQPDSRHSKSGLLKNLVQAFLLGSVLNFLRSGNHHGANAGCHFVPLGHSRRRAQIFQPRVGAGTDEHAIDANLLHRRARLQAHVFEHALGIRAIRFR